MTQEENKLPEVPFIAPQELRVALDAFGALSGSLGGRELKNIRARAAFPFSAPDEFIELREETGELLGFVRHVSELDPGSAAAVSAAAKLGRLVPKIKRIFSIRGSGRMRTWRVETDRGKTEFQVRGRRWNVEEIGGGEHIVTDTEGNRFRIPAVPELDARSLMQLRKVL